MPMRQRVLAEPAQPFELMLMAQMELELDVERAVSGQHGRKLVDALQVLLQARAIDSAVASRCTVISSVA